MCGILTLLYRISEDKDWDFGTGAGFYLTATSEAYKKHYNMYEHIVKEIPDVLEKANIGIVSLGVLSLPFGISEECAKNAHR